MKFCAYCGRQLQDDEVCTCRDAQKTAEEVKTAGENVQAEVSTAAADVQAQTAQDAQGAAPASDYYQAPYMSNAQPPKGGRKWLIPVLCAAGALAVVAIVVCAMSLFKGPKSKIGKATVKTFADTGYLARDLSSFNYDSGKYSMTVSGKYQKIEVGMGVSVNSSEMQMSASVKDKDVDLSAIVELGKKAVKAKLNGADYKKVLVYDFTNDDKGDIEDLAGEKNIETIDEALTALADSLGKSKTSTQKYEKVLSKWLNGLKVEKEDSKSIKVDGEKRDCKGYSVEITPDDIMDLADPLMDLLEEDAADLLEQMGYKDLDDLKEQLEKAVDKMEDIEIEFYLYKDMFAAIDIEYDKDELYIEFNGGDYRLQNVKVYEGKKSDNQVLMEISGKTSGDKETLSIEVPNEFKADYSYDKKSGKFEVNASEYNRWYGEYTNGVTVKGTLECSKSKVTLTVKDFSVEGTSIPIDKLEITISSKDNMESMKGTEFNIDKADEDDLKDELMELYESVMDALSESDTLSDLLDSLKYMF